MKLLRNGFSKQRWPRNSQFHSTVFENESLFKLASVHQPKMLNVCSSTVKHQKEL